MRDELDADDEYGRGSGAEVRLSAVLRIAAAKVTGFIVRRHEALHLFAPRARYAEVSSKRRRKGRSPSSRRSVKPGRSRLSDDFYAKRPAKVLDRREREFGPDAGSA
jgi:hypothetical protein